MLFSINEDGDLNIDEKKVFSDFVISDKLETNFRLTKTILLTHLIHKKWLRENFILYKRNNFQENEIRNEIQQKLNDIFQKYPSLLPHVNFIFTNEKNTLNIIFFNKSGKENKLLLQKEIVIG